MLREVGARSSVETLIGPLIDGKLLAEQIAEPLQESAPVAFASAMGRCDRDHDGTCQAYHAVWQYLRLVNIAPSVRVDGSLYVAAAERLARAGRLRRVLITASADYSMLAHLAFGARRGGADPVFDVVDRCATALELNEWYAKRNGLSVRTIQAHMPQRNDSGPYDLICSHSFIQWLPSTDRGPLFKVWQDSLAPDGRICLSNRVWTRDHVLSPEEMAERVNAMIQKAMGKLDQSGVALPCAREQFAELLHAYGYRRRDRHPALPLADFERWIDEAGLAIEIAVPGAKVVAENYDYTPSPFSIERGPRMWFQLRQA
ncbi:MAG: class I SAM-dependent methyltransferase [Dongiaceae bacterium]